MYPVAFGFFDSETTDNWTWFFEQLQRAIGNPPFLALSSDACKGQEKAVKNVFPRAEHRECFWHLMQNFIKKFQGPVYGNMYPVARTFTENRFEHYMNKILDTTPEVASWLKKNHNLLWMRCRFLEEIKCDFITNNLAEVFNNWVKDIKDLPIAELADTLRSKMMQLYAKQRKIGERLQDTMLPIVVRQLQAMTRCCNHLRVVEGGNHVAEVTEVTNEHEVLRHAVNLTKHKCSCREWQVLGKPWPHALAVITTTRNPVMADYLHPYYSVYNFRLAYAGIIQPLTDKFQWPKVNLGFRLLPPMTKRSVGRQRKNRIPGCLEKKGRTKGLWQITCNSCGGKGHRESGPKCPNNGTKKKRKSRAKIGRPLGDASSRTPKRQKVARNDSNTASPGPTTRRQLALSNDGGEGTSQQVATPRRSPRNKAAKKLTPRKGNK
uniref:SWIM-type domain-containing protein n=1 Tax=Arundo donax TaxID=35708 RepID=A0A0A8ZEQ7_ARUDO